MKTKVMFLSMICLTLSAGRAQQAADALKGSATLDGQAKISRIQQEGTAPAPVVPASRNTGTGDPPDSIHVDVMPAVVQRANPVYPKEAIEKKLEGMVWVKIFVDKEGNAKEVQVIKSSDDLFNNSAVEAAKQFTFTPATQGEKKVDVWVTVPFKYKLADKPAPRPEKQPGSKRPPSKKK